MEPRVTEHDQLLDVMQTASLVRVSRRTLCRWADEGIGPPALRLGPTGRLLRYRLGDVREWLRQCQQRTA